MTRTSSNAAGERMAVFEQAASYALETLDRVPLGALDRPSPCRGWSVGDVILHLADVSDAVIDLVRIGELRLPAPRDRDTADPAAHGWDIATALDMERPIPDATATALLALAEGRLTDAHRGDKFAAAVPVPAAAAPSDRFVAFLGRRPA